MQGLRSLYDPDDYRRRLGQTLEDEGESAEQPEAS
jgi:hypothetical protein